MQASDSRRRFPKGTDPPDPTHAARARAGWLALVVGAFVFGGKLAAWRLTNSTAVLSDALESVVNLAAAGLLIFALWIAARPADRDHPYGHGKVEFFSAGIEGTLIALAAVLILVEAVRDLVVGPELRSIDAGILLLLCFSGVNAWLGAMLVRTGRRTGSLALVADGRHVLTDVWTSAAVVAGLLGVRLTGWTLLDPLVAIAAAANILREGWKLTRDAVAGLMDAADDELLGRLADAIEASRRDEWIDVHSLRAWRSGAALHADLHLVVPRYLDAERLHAVHDQLGDVLMGAARAEGDIVVHFDPCRPNYCAICGVGDCPVRSAPLETPQPLTLERVTRGEQRP